jgi:hypothetical protein
VTSRGFVVFVNGGYGVGKSSVLDHVGDLLAARRQPFALMDVDWFHRSWPPAMDDPTNTAAEAMNMAVVWRNYRAAGPRQLVVSGIMTQLADRRRYEDAFGLPVRSVRLEASAAVTVERLRTRYRRRSPTPLQWHLERFAELVDRVRLADLDELVVQTDDHPPGDSAELIIHHFNLGGPHS